MRHRILDVINLSLKNDKVEGIVEVDECFIKESFKGNHSKSTTFVMPRNPRKRGKGKNDKKKRGISKEQICIENGDIVNSSKLVRQRLHIYLCLPLDFPFLFTSLH